LWQFVQAIATKLPQFGTDASGSEQAGQDSDEVDEKNDQIAFRRIVAGRETLKELRAQ
jgi:hypothetical protein